ncbi:Two-component sensor histidine kinase, contains HisKA and HATPase domains [Alkalispirochaeta americana]|uniref:histidine kinase n=1 Tax=Alkalispirochaeta americana TaxID=159291 RepID=A0A1N6T483_9SPIO|nr:sensor histidine kinase [Alkalispirochaeta americana]SIQ48188.1 Two-component sensor histidine kinase, contains HisKA and HATPase domains [Alkalispirochaeta americana]
MKIFSSLKQILLFLYLFSTVIPLLFLGGVSYSTLRGVLEEEVVATQHLLSREMASRVSRVAFEAESVLNYARAILRDAAGKQSSREVQNLLARLVENYDFFKRLTLLDETGRVTLSVPASPEQMGLDMSRQQFFLERGKGDLPLWSRAFVSLETGSPTATLSVPLGESVLVGFLDLSVLGSIVSGIRLGETGFALIRDQVQTVIAHPDPRYVQEMRNMTQLPDPGDPGDGYGETRQFYLDGRAYQGLSVSVEPSGWSLSLLQERAEALAPVRTILTTILVVLACVLLLGTLISFSLYWRILKPVKRLVEQTGQISSGVYRFGETEASFREVEALHHAFVAMGGVLEAREGALRDSLREKEVLLQEVHHRVKNNFQMIISLLNLQMLQTPQEDAQEAFIEAEGRIRSMALVHEKIYRSDSLSRIDFGSYIGDILEELYLAYSAQDQGISLDSHVEEVDLSINEAIPCGLILNELVTNVLKHAYPPGFTGEKSLGIRFHRVRKQEAELVVWDRGVGASLSEQGEFSLGKTLVQQLARQLKGDLSVTSSEGTVTTLRFPLTAASS